jgi:hypothetical protein
MLDLHPLANLLFMAENSDPVLSRVIFYNLGHSFLALESVNLPLRLVPGLLASFMQIRVCHKAIADEFIN